jgi:hypothetical protein
MEPEAVVPIRNSVPIVTGGITQVFPASSIVVIEFRNK